MITVETAVPPKLEFDTPVCEPRRVCVLSPSCGWQSVVSVLRANVRLQLWCLVNLSVVIQAEQLAIEFFVLVERKAGEFVGASCLQWVWFLPPRELSCHFPCWQAARIAYTKLICCVGRIGF